MTPEQWEQIGQFYEAAKELEPAERPAFLDRACVGDEALRREVEALLAAEASIGDFIETSALKDAAALLNDEAPESMAGKQLGHYQLLSLVGAGGMGEVYAARDTRLGRKVAVKLLPSSVSRDADLLRRFEQEARAIGMLNHPNVLTMHDIGTYNGAPYIVSELLEGETLREQIKDSRVTTRKAIEFALQIIRGLAAAHERGLAHRDLKPENLFITKDGRVKILDFGLAKLVQNRLTRMDASGLTYPGVRTNPGMVMGTVGYMSPEQVRGEEADHRADIFAFGVILHEMLTGERPFRGDTAVETMNAILKEDAPELPGSVNSQSPGLKRVIHRCLEKSPEQRFQSASDLGFALEALTSSDFSPSLSRLPTVPGEATPALALGHKQGWISTLRWGWLGWLVSGVFLIATILLALAYLGHSAPEARPFRFSISPPNKAARVSDPVVSPDGRHLAYVANAEGKTQIWVRPMDSLAAQPLPDTERAMAPFWSPDGQSLGFFAEGKLKKVAISGGTSLTLADAPENKGGAWGEDEVILYVPHQNAGVHRVSAAGGSVAAVTTLEGSSSHLWPCFLPDGRHFLYLVTGLQGEEAGVYLASLDGREKRRLLTAESNVSYAPSNPTSAAGVGYLLYAMKGALLAQPFDPTARRLVGEPVRLVDRVEVGVAGKGFFSVSENGVLVFSSSSSSPNQQPGWFDRAGKPAGLIGSAGAFINNAELTPDGKRVAVTRFDPQLRTADIWLFDLARGAESNFTPGPASDFFPVWSPDGSRIIWTSIREGLFSFYQKLSNGSGQEELLLSSGRQKHPTSWSSDGRLILYQENDPQTKWDVWLLPLEGDRKPLPFAQTQYNETNGRFSPNSKWIAYTSDESGRNEVYLQDFHTPSPTSHGRSQISSRGGDQPRWRHDGKELFYVSADGKLMAVEVKSGVVFEAGVPRELFDLRSVKAPGGNYIPAGDGKKFLLTTSLEGENVEPFTVVLNWMGELHR
jgi:eukaryotic-like serine/threonine-protein kinase